MRAAISSPAPVCCSNKVTMAHFHRINTGDMGRGVTYLHPRLAARLVYTGPQSY